MAIIFSDGSFEHLGALENENIILFIGRGNPKKDSINIQKLVNQYSKFTFIWMESPYLFLSKISKNFLKKINLNRLESEGQVRSSLRKFIKLFFLLRHPKFWKFFLKKEISSLLLRFHLLRLATNQERHIAKEIGIYSNLIYKIGKNKNWIIISQSAGGIIGSRLLSLNLINRLVCFGYPFKHPNYKNEPYRTEHLRKITKPFVIFQGINDEYGNYNSTRKYKLPESIEILSVNCTHDNYNKMSKEDWMICMDKLRLIIR